MFNVAELKLLESDLTLFPMIKAASAGQKRCKTCRHGSFTTELALRIAVTHYAKKREFIEHCNKLFPLPCIIGGVLIDKGATNE